MEIAYVYIFTFMALLFCATWLFISLAIYFITVIVAFVRKHNNILAISIMTTFLGWTFFGWLAALLWSLNSDVKDDDCD